MKKLRPPNEASLSLSAPLSGSTLKVNVIRYKMLILQLLFSIISIPLCSLAYSLVQAPLLSNVTKDEPKIRPLVLWHGLGVYTVWSRQFQIDVLNCQYYLYKGTLTTHPG